MERDQQAFGISQNQGGGALSSDGTAGLIWLGNAARGIVTLQ